MLGNGLSRRQQPLEKTIDWPAEPRSAATHRKRRWRGIAPPWWFVLPALALYAFVVLVPSVKGVWYAFSNWDGLSPTYKMIGLGNFRTLLHDPDARGALEHTLLIAVSITILQNGVGLLLALGVNSKIKSRNLLRVFFFAPAVLTPIVTAYLWQNLLSPDGGVNVMLRNLGLARLVHPWLGSPKLAVWAVVFVIIWQFAGYSMVIFLAGLQSIPQEIYEATALDGAGPVRRFRSVTWPLLAPALTINLMLSIIGGIKLFDQVWGLTNGGPGHASETLSTLLYKDAFQLGEFAYGITIAVVLTVIVAVVSGGQYALLRRNERSGT
jgi:raffinose/stachyose/melibiose transport system permease protein